MISHKEMMGMIASEAVEGYEPQVRGTARQGYIDRKPSIPEQVRGSDSPSLRYNLRLVRYADGRLEWED